MGGDDQGNCPTTSPLHSASKKITVWVQQYALGYLQLGSSPRFGFNGGPVHCAPSVDVPGALLFILGVCCLLQVFSWVDLRGDSN